MNQREQAEKDGASARALGRDRRSNPYYVDSGMPSVTGERFDEWHAKAVGWEAGWRAEELVRADTGGTRAPARGLGMTLERARTIVIGVEGEKYLRLGDGEAALDGSYTAEQLEAIAVVLYAGR